MDTNRNDRNEDAEHDGSRDALYEFSSVLIRSQSRSLPLCFLIFVRFVSFVVEILRSAVAEQSKKVRHDGTLQEALQTAEPTLQAKPD